MSSDRSGRYVFGAILIFLGIVLLLPSLNLSIFGWDNIWPCFIILAGLAFLLGWLVSSDHDPGLVFVGSGALLVGLFLGLFAWGYLGWYEMAVYWPVFPFIGGVAFLALWAAGGAKEHGILVPAVGGLLTGLIGLALTLKVMDFEVFAKWWPVLIILLGLLVLAGRLFDNKKE